MNGNLVVGGEENFILIFLSIICVGVLLYLFFTREGVQESKRVGPGLTKIFKYYQSALHIVFKNWWMIVIPIGIYALSVSFTLIRFIIYAGNNSSSWGGIFSSYPWEIFLSDLVRLPQYLLSGILRSWLGTTSAFITLICVIFYKPIAARLARLTGPEDENLIFLKKMLRNVLLAISFLMLAHSINNFYMRSIVRGGVPFWRPTIYLMGIIYILVMASILLVALFQGAFISVLINKSQKRRLNFKELIISGMSRIQTLFFFNLFLVIIFNIRTIIFMITNNLMYIGSPFTVSNGIVTILVIYLPLIIVLENKGILESLKYSFQFIKKFIIPFLIFIIIGLGLLFVPTFLNNVIDLSIFGMLQRQLVDLIFKLLRIAFSMISLTAMYRFFIEYRGKMEE